MIAQPNSVASELRQLVADMRNDFEDGNYLQPLIEPSPMFRTTNIPCEQ